MGDGFKLCDLRIIGVRSRSCFGMSISKGNSNTSLTNSRGSRVAGPKSRSRVQSRGRGSKVAVGGPKSRSRVQCRGRGSKVAVAGPKSRQGKMIWGSR